MQVDGHGAFPSGIVAEAHLSLMMLLLRREGGREGGREKERKREREKERKREREKEGGKDSGSRWV